MPLICTCRSMRPKTSNPCTPQQPTSPEKYSSPKGATTRNLARSAGVAPRYFCLRPPKQICPCTPGSVTKVPAPYARVDLRLAHRRARGGRLASRPPGRHRRLARAVQVVEGDMRASFVEAPHKRHGQRGSDGGHVLEGPRATYREVVQDLGQEGGRARERRGAVVPDELGHVRRVLLAARPRQDDLAAGDERREHLPLNHGPDNRRLHDGPACRIQLTSLGELRGPMHDAVVGVQDRLGAPGAPRSPHHDRARG
mmetsp:Transcript_41516/g.107431  ORF Transcript_41516/g.107431 Transcript_41516/m.107431 type:complete len:255 (+) Transcript_41516:426-1190(+)